MKRVFPSCALCRLPSPDEEPLAAVGDQYMFGPDLLIAPVVDEGTFEDYFVSIRRLDELVGWQNSFRARKAQG